MADQQRHGTKRKSQDGNDANTRVTKHKAESVPDAEPAAKSEGKAPAAPPPTERFLMSEFKTCLFSCIAQRYLGVKETVKEHTSELLETYGTWPHPMDATKMTFRAWAFRFEMLRVLRTTTELSVENREELPNGLYCRRGLRDNVLSICLDYVDTLATLRMKMAVGYAMLTTRLNSIVHFEIEGGYARSVDVLPVAVPDITCHWASHILAHAKHVKPHTFLCAAYDTWMHCKEVPDMYYNETGEIVWLYGLDDNADFLDVTDLVDEFPISAVFDGCVTIPGTSVKAPAPGTFPGVHKDLAEIAKSVAPNKLPAWKLAKAYASDRGIHGRCGELITTLDPAYCVNPSQEAIEWAELLVVCESDNDD